MGFSPGPGAAPADQCVERKLRSRNHLEPIGTCRGRLHPDHRPGSIGDDQSEPVIATHLTVHHHRVPRLARVLKHAMAAVQAKVLHPRHPQRLLQEIHDRLRLPRRPASPADVHILAGRFGVIQRFLQPGGPGPGRLRTEVAPVFRAVRRNHQPVHPPARGPFRRTNDGQTQQQHGQSNTIVEPATIHTNLRESTRQGTSIQSSRIDSAKSTKPPSLASTNPFDRYWNPASKSCILPAL